MTKVRRRAARPAFDPADDYLIALATAERAVLVSGDAQLTVLVDRIPVRTPAVFLASLEA
jgi:predicted nucleic acid-binding protein